MKLIRFLQIATILLVMLFFLAPIMLTDLAWPSAARDYFFNHAEAETGAHNTVSAIYLGYRAMDTLGETLVLLVAVAGTMAILHSIEDEKSLVLSPEKRASHKLRTNLLEVVSGKVGPIILLFGLYVMLYGHISPGGGFQGGVILASGIVFLALGSESETKLTHEKVLSHLESASFLILVLASASGLVAGNGLLSNPFLDSSPVHFIILLNIIIGLKVGTSIAVMCIAMMGGSHGH